MSYVQVQVLTTITECTSRIIQVAVTKTHGVTVYKYRSRAVVAL